MTTAANTAKCKVCLKDFTRDRPRQLKCQPCVDRGVFCCAQCEGPFIREDGNKLCADCLARLAPPTGENVAEWGKYLELSGHSESRGLYIGQGRVVYESAEQAQDRAELDGRIEMGNEIDQRLIAYSNEELLGWFLGESANAVGNTLGLHAVTVQRLRASYFDIDTAQVEAARRALGFTDEAWRRRRLGLALERMRGDLALRDLREAA